MRLYEVIWKEVFVDKLEQKHRVMPDEAEQVLFSKPFIRRAEKGRVQGEDVYVACVCRLWSNCSGKIPCGLLHSQVPDGGVTHLCS
jgi:hypothetical protein